MQKSITSRNDGNPYSNRLQRTVRYAVHGMDYLLTWNCRHIDNAVTKPIVRSLCAVGGYQCPEICTPLELLSEESSDV